MKKRILVILAVLVPVMLLMPFTAAAVTNPEIISMMQAVIQGVLSAGRDAYCAAGVAAFCP